MEIFGRRRKKIAIVGTAPSTVAQVKDLFGNDEWEIWVLNIMYRVMPDIVPHVSRWFQMHPRDLKEIFRDYNCWSWYAAQNHFTLYTLEKEPDIKISVPYPKDTVMKDIRALSQDPDFRLFTSSPSWMIALAIHERVEEITLYGLDMSADEEWRFESPSVRYFIGLARGMGIKVNVPYKSNLLKSALLYGYDDHTLIKLKFRQRRKDLQNTIREKEYAEQLARDDRMKSVGAFENMRAVEDNFLYNLKWE